MTAQTLTQAANEPIVGDMNNFKGHDSVGVVPKNTGSAQTWNFSSFTLNTNTLSSTFQSTTAVGASSAFPGSTIAENQGGGSYNFYKTVGSQYEMTGSSSTGGDFTYTNTAIVANWPVAMGYSLTDTYAGNLSGGLAGTLSGTITSEATGTGSLTIPGGTSFSNVLQVRVKNKVFATVTSPFPTTFTVTGTDYMYYHSSQKFPLMQVSYQATTGFTNTTSADIYLNNALITGLNDKNFDATFQIFPNPAKSAFSVNLTNAAGETGVVYIYNSIGQLVKQVELGNESVLAKNIAISDLSSGIYVVKTALGSKTSSRKLVVE